VVPGESSYGSFHNWRVSWLHFPTKGLVTNQRKVPVFAPQTGTKARGGITDREATYILRKLVQTGNVVSMDLVEINPELDKDKATIREVYHGDNKLIQGTQTVCMGLELIQAILGQRLLL